MTPVDDVTRRQSLVILLLLVGLGLALRSVRITDQSLWADEALTGVLVHYPWWSFAWASVDPSPPLFYWLEKALVAEGAGPVAWRSVSLVAGTATIGLVYWLAHELKSRVAGLVAAGLVAVSAPLVDYSQEARAYALAVALITCSAASLAALTGGRVNGDDNRGARRRMLAIFGISTILAIFSHFIALLWVVPALIILRLAAAERHRVEPREAWMTIGVTLPFLAIELRRLLVYRAEQDGFNWLAQMSPGRLVEILGEQWLPFAPAGALLALALLWVARGALMNCVRSRPLQALVVAVLLAMPIGMWLIGMVATPVAMPRTFLPASIGFAALLGVAIASLERRARAVVGVAAVSLSLASLLVIGTVRPKEQWASAVGVTQKAPIVIVCPNWKVPAYLAASKSPAWVITSSRNKALAVRQPGDRTAWDRLYFDRVQRFSHSALRPDVPLQIEQRQIAGASLMFIASECSDVERRAFAEWAGLREARPLWSSPTVDDAAGISVEEWQLNGAKPLDLWIVR